MSDIILLIADIRCPVSFSFVWRCSVMCHDLIYRSKKTTRSSHHFKSQLFLVVNWLAQPVAGLIFDSLFASDLRILLRRNKIFCVSVNRPLCLPSIYFHLYVSIIFKCYMFILSQSVFLNQLD